MLLGFLLGILGSILYTTQFIWNWFGTDSVQKAVYSLFCVVLILGACAGAYVGQKQKRLSNPGRTFGKFMFFGFIIVVLFICIVSGASMTLDTGIDTYFKSDMGFFTGFRWLTSVTSEDLNTVANWAIGLKMVIKTLFLIVPFLICVWGGLSVLTATSLDEAEGGIMAVVAAFIVVIIVWLFKLVEISLA